MKNEYESFRKLARKAFGVAEAEENLSDEELQEIRQDRKDWKEAERKAKEDLRELRENVAEGLNDILPDDVAFEWEEEV